MRRGGRQASRPSRSIRSADAIGQVLQRLAADGLDGGYHLQRQVGDARLAARRDAHDLGLGRRDFLEAGSLHIVHADQLAAALFELEFRQPGHVGLAHGARLRVGRAACGAFCRRLGWGVERFNATGRRRLLVHPAAGRQHHLGGSAPGVALAAFAALRPDMAALAHVAVAQPLVAGPRPLQQRPALGGLARHRHALGGDGLADGGVADAQAPRSRADGDILAPYAAAA
ncbi:MAG: hypothetical protein ACK5QX_08620, partial [bacterium]